MIKMPKREARTPIAASETRSPSMRDFFGKMDPLMVVTRVETLLQELQNATTLDKMIEIEAGFKGMRLFKPNESEIAALTEFSKTKEMVQYANKSKFIITSYRVLIQTIISRSVKEELSREQTLFTNLLTGARQK